MLEKLTIDDFSKFLQHTFQILTEAGGEESADASLKAVLVEVTQLRERQENENKRVPFSIVLLGPSEPVLPQQIYSLKHEVLGRVDLFLVPLGPDKGGMLYEAVFT